MQFARRPNTNPRLIRLINPHPDPATKPRCGLSRFVAQLALCCALQAADTYLLFSLLRAAGTQIGCTSCLCQMIRNLRRMFAQVAKRRVHLPFFPRLPNGVVTQCFEGRQTEKHFIAHHPYSSCLSTIRQRSGGVAGYPRRGARRLAVERSVKADCQLQFGVKEGGLSSHYHRGRAKGLAEFAARRRLTYARKPR